MRVLGALLIVAVVYAWVRFFRWGLHHQDALNRAEERFTELPVALALPMFFVMLWGVAATILLLIFAISWVVDG